MPKIISKVHERGHEMESSWPSDYGTGEKGRWFYDKEGQPHDSPVNVYPKFGEAPQVIFDTMPATYHEQAGRVIESRREWNMADEQTGSLTFGSIEEPKRHISRGLLEEKNQAKRDRRNAALSAIQKYSANPREVQAKLEKRGEQQLEVLKKAGLDGELKQRGVRHHDRGSS